MLDTIWNLRIVKVKQSTTDSSSTFLYTSKFDYLFFMSDEMRLVGEVCEDLMGGEVTAVQHPFVYSNNLHRHRPYPYEVDNPMSTAYVNPSENRQYKNEYYVGSLYGGRTLQMLHLLLECNENMQWDYDELNGYVARRGEESYLNRFIKYNFMYFNYSDNFDF